MADCVPGSSNHSRFPSDFEQSWRMDLYNSLDCLEEEDSDRRPPLLDSANFALWKVRMIDFLFSLGPRVWQIVEKGYEAPQMVRDGVYVLKPMDQWDVSDYVNFSNNGKALYAILNGVSQFDFYRISACKIAKDAWDILCTTHKETPQVKEAKLHCITTKFESMHMQDNETFDEFYAKLNAVVNSSFDLEEIIPQDRIVRKLMNSLPKSFLPKVIVLESMPNFPTMKVEEVVGHLQAFEATWLQYKSPKERVKRSEKTIAFSSTQDASDDSDCDDELDLKEIALFFKNFKKLLEKKKPRVHESERKKGNDKIRTGPSGAKAKKGSKGRPSGPQCYECRGYGHIAQECANNLRKKKVFAVKTRDEEDSDES